MTSRPYAELREDLVRRLMEAPPGPERERLKRVGYAISYGAGPRMLRRIDFPRRTDGGYVADLLRNQPAPRRHSRAMLTTIITVWLVGIPVTFIGFAMLLRWALGEEADPWILVVMSFAWPITLAMAINDTLRRSDDRERPEEGSEGGPAAGLPDREGEGRRAED